MSKVKQIDIIDEDEIKLMKNSVMIFIRANMQKYDYDRMNDLLTNHGFQSYVNFIEHNTRCVNESSNDDITFMSMMIDWIHKRKINLCDKEDCIEWIGDSFYFNINNELVLTHPR